MGWDKVFQAMIDDEIVDLDYYVEPPEFDEISDGGHGLDSVFIIIISVLIIVRLFFL